MFKRTLNTHDRRGSDTMSGLWQPLRELAAKMREMLKNNAKKKILQQLLLKPKPRLLQQQMKLKLVGKPTCAIDPGIVINPDAVKAQCEGAIIMGLNAAMFEKMEIKNGAVGPTIYGAYKMALMKHAPREIDVVLLEGGNKPPGVGEPPLRPIGAAIGNAVFSLTGERLRNLPLSS